MILDFESVRNVGHFCAATDYSGVHGDQGMPQCIHIQYLYSSHVYSTCMHSWCPSADTVCSGLLNTFTSTVMYMWNTYELKRHVDANVHKHMKCCTYHRLWTIYFYV